MIITKELKIKSQTSQPIFIIYITIQFNYTETLTSMSLSDHNPSRQQPNNNGTVIESATKPITKLSPRNKDQQSLNQPVLIESFQGDLSQAISFYCKQVNKLFFANIVLNSQLKTAIDQKKQLAELINSLQRSDRNSQELRQRRHRRSASEIERSFQCPALKCGKCYGSEGSLTQHIKLKHPGHQFDEGSGDRREQDPC